MFTMLSTRLAVPAVSSSAPGPSMSPPKADQDAQVRDAVLERVLEDGLNVERTLATMQRDFGPKLSQGFVYNCLRAGRIGQLDLAEHRQMVLQKFSGTLCIDELHLGRFILLLATDPIADLPVAFALVGRNDQGHMRRFLKNLKTAGLSPPSGRYRWLVPVSDRAG